MLLVLLVELVVVLLLLLLALVSLSFWRAFDGDDEKLVVNKAFAVYPIALKVNIFVTILDSIIKAIENKIAVLILYLFFLIVIY